MHHSANNSNIKYYYINGPPHLTPYPNPQGLTPTNFSLSYTAGPTSPHHPMPNPQGLSYVVSYLNLCISHIYSDIAQAAP